MEPGADTSYVQVGALPYRLSRAGEPEVLLVTSRGTRQWIIPKGWPIEGKTNAESAAREAYEEAGLLGEVGETLAGHFTYEKARKGEETLSPFSVEVYWLRVERQLTLWPEASQRDLVWVSPAQAVSMITNKSLADLIATIKFPVR
ncbi:NUDIX hydrolase [Asticcacaulis solisilvae]|uniref:NUDIX hydrolase n=1 Tax=Asticcacaulis solisilvae TaxID=1217274 RepID=UPI003FD7E5EC